VGPPNVGRRTRGGLAGMWRQTCGVHVVTGLRVPDAGTRRTWSARGRSHRRRSLASATGSMVQLAICWTCGCHAATGDLTSDNSSCDRL
jgi:hypothetical protein